VGGTLGAFGHIVLPNPRGEGGGMIAGGSLAMLVMSRMPSNYGWREAQEEEIDGALRVGVSASATSW
jgi:hypothetical protein